METERKPKAELTNLTVKEGSVVDNGDNPEAKVLMIKGSPSIMQRVKDAWSRVRGGVQKSGDEYQEQPRTTAQIIAEDDFRSKFYGLKMAFMRSIHSIMSGAPAEDMGAMLAKSVEEFASAATEMAGKANFTKAEELNTILAELAACTKETDLAKVAGAVEKLEHFEVPDTNTNKGDGKPVEPTTNKETGTMEKKTITLEEAVKGISDPGARALIEAQLKEVETNKAAAQQTNNLLSDLAKRVDAFEKRATDAEAKVQKLEQEKQEGEFLAKAKAFRIPGQTTAEVANTLQAAYAISKEAGEGIEKSFSAMHVAASKSSAIFTAFGKATHDNGEAPTAGQGIEARAAELMKADPKLSKAKAFVKAMDENPGRAHAAINQKAAE